MEITYSVIVFIVTYVLGAISKIKFDNMPNNLIPLQNVLIGLISTLVCYFAGIESNILQSFVLCMTASMGAGGVADLNKITNQE